MGCGPCLRWGNGAPFSIFHGCLFLSTIRHQLSTYHHHLSQRMNATLKPSFWSDRRLESLTKDHKYALIWLITNANRDLCGFTEVSARHFTLETDLPLSTLNEACAGSGGNFKALPDNIYFVRRFLRHQFGCGGRISQANKVIKAAVKRVNSMPQEMADAFYEAYPELSGERMTDADSYQPASPEAMVPYVDSPSIPHPSPILNDPCPDSRVTTEQEKEQEQEKPRTEGNGVALSTMDAVEAADASISNEGSGHASPPPDAATIASLYPRRQSVQEAMRHISRHIMAGADPRAIADGTRAIAAVIRQLPSGHLNAYVPSAEKFFANRRWEDDPQTWLRMAPAKGNRALQNGAQPTKLSLGGRTGTTIRIHESP